MVEVEDMVLAKVIKLETSYIVPIVEETCTPRKHDEIKIQLGIQQKEKLVPPLRQPTDEIYSYNKAHQLLPHMQHLQVVHLFTWFLLSLFSVLTWIVDLSATGQMSGTRSQFSSYKPSSHKNV